MTSCPSSARSAAATDESTPPDIATTIRIRCRLDPPRRHEDTKNAVSKKSSRLRVFVASHGLARQPAELLDEPREDVGDTVNRGFGRVRAEAEAQGILRPMR